MHFLWLWVRGGSLRYLGTSCDCKEHDCDQRKCPYRPHFGMAEAWSAAVLYQRRIFPHLHPIPQCRVSQRHHSKPTTLVSGNWLVCSFSSCSEADDGCSLPRSAQCWLRLFRFRTTLSREHSRQNAGPPQGFDGDDSKRHREKVSSRGGCERGCDDGGGNQQASQVPPCPHPRPGRHAPPDLSGEPLRGCAQDPAASV